MSFKTIAYTVLENSNKPLHYETITRIARKTGKLEAAGKNPEATMNAALIVDINKHKNKSAFIKVAPGTYGLNPAVRKEDFLWHNMQEKIMAAKGLSTQQNRGI